MSWEILAVRYGDLASTKAKLHHDWAAHGEPDGPQHLAYYVYVLRDGERTVLVDTGFSVEQGLARGREVLVAPREGIARLGVAPEDVGDLVVSHLHYDHIGNPGGWPNARLHVPGIELDYWASEEATAPEVAVHTDLDGLAWFAERDRAGRVERYEGPVELLPGITAILIGGHSPGQHVLLVETAGGPVLLASDAVHLYSELERTQPFGVFHDLDRMLAGFDVIRSLVADRGALFVPGHDPLVAERVEALDDDRLLLRIA